MIFNRVYYRKKKQSAEGVVVLDLEQGDQTVLPAEGEAFSSVVVRKPESLIPENIRKGSVIAGVTGTFEGTKTYLYAEGVMF